MSPFFNILEKYIEIFLSLVVNIFHLNNSKLFNSFLYVFYIFSMGYSWIDSLVFNGIDPLTYRKLNFGIF